MDRKFANVIFALLSVLLLAGGAFAASSNSAASSNKAPVITGVGGPTSLSAGQAGTWSVSAHDPDGTYLSYSVNWGEGSSISPSASDSSGSTATFQHTYYTAGTYTITFTVADSKGASTQSTVTVSVTGTSANHPPAFTSVTCPVTGASVTCYVHASDPDGDPVTYIVGFGDTNTEVSGMQNVFAHTYANAGTYTISVRAMDKYGAETGTSLQVKVTGNENQKPIITSVGGPTSLSAGQVGTWTVSAYDPDGTYLSYSVNWGDEGGPKSASDSLQAGSTATFQHTYAKAGTYTITFTVADNLGASAVSTVTATVGGNSGSDMVTADVTAVPAEVKQYDSVYVAGKVSLGSTASNDEPHTFYVVLSLGNGNSIASAYSSATGSEQVRVEEITLSPGESKEVSAYFTATQLGTNFAKIAVYLKSGSTHKLVASDSEKVLVTDSGIPSPPADRIILKFERGWNQVSVPTNYTITMQDIASKCDVSTTAWYYDAASKQYVQATSLGYGHAGVWIKANSECTYELDAPYYSPEVFDLKAGWNMIGAPLQATAISNFAGDCKITSGPWRYSASAGQYSYSSKLEPGKGHWVKVASDCKLGSASDMPPAAPTEVAPPIQAVQTQAVAQSAQTVTPAATAVQTQTVAPRTEPAQATQTAANTKSD